MLKAWPTIPMTWEQAASGLWTPRDWVSTGTAGAIQQAHQRSGWTVWQLPQGTGSATVGWEWVEIDQGVVARGNLSAVATNVQWLDTDARPMQTPPYPQLLHARLIHHLQWQAHLVQSLACSTHRTAPMRFEDWRVQYWPNVTEED